MLLHRISPIWLFAILAALLVASASADQSIVEEPEDTVARLGETVVLRCRVKDQKGQVIWMQGDIGLGSNRDLPFWERMRMVGSLNDGEFHLEIRNVSLEDEETYQCQLSSTDEEPQAKLSKRARLTVIVEPQAPVLLGESIAQLPRTQPIAATEGRPIRLSCQSRAGKPPARLSWAVAEDWEAQKLVARIMDADNGTAVSEQTLQSTHVHPIRAREHLHSVRPALRNLVGNITELVERDEHTGLYTLTSHLTFGASDAENGRWLVCSAAHDTYGRESRTASVRLDVYYAPKVRIIVEDEDAGQTQEGGQVRLRCVADARPAEGLKFEWSWDGEPKRLERLDSQTSVVGGLRFNDNGRRVTCSAENSIGVGNGVLELDVQYGPRFMSTNQTRIVERGGQATFQCEVLGNPAPTIRWYHGRDTDTQMHEGRNYTVNNAQDWEEGEYRCTAEVEGFAPKTLHHTLYLKGPPKVSLADSFVSDGSAKTLVCRVQHRTERVKVHWYHNGRRVDMDAGLQPADDRRYLVKDERTSRWELVSRLTVRRPNDADYGHYNCSARNEYGVGWDQQLVRHVGVLDAIRRWGREAERWLADLPLEARASLVAGLVFCALVVLCCCVLRCRRSGGHSKFSNPSKSSGDIGIRCEEMLDANTTSSTPLYATQQPFYADQDYLCDSQFDPNCDPSVIQYGPSGHYSPNGLPSVQFGGTGEHYPNGTSSTFAEHQQQQQYAPSYGAGTTFGHHHPHQGQNGSIGNEDLYDPALANGALLTNSFGVPCYQPQQQYYLAHPHQQFMSPSPLEPVTEVCTPESAHGDPHLLNGLEPQQQRPISRISTHV